MLVLNADLSVGRRNEDAERDCTRALELSPNNVKALFRRSQAKSGRGNLTEAHKGVYRYTAVNSFHIYSVFSLRPFKGT